MYEVFHDPYCYPGTAVLKNKLDIRDSDKLSAFEAEMSRERAGEPLPRGRFGRRHYMAVHRHLFQDVYSWAGRIRTVRIAKGGSMFCYPEFIEGETRKLFAWLGANRFLRGLPSSEFAIQSAHFLSELNVIHPFRDGNGRTQLAFLALLGSRAGYQIDYQRLQPKIFLDAMISGFNGDEGPLSEQIGAMIEG